MSQFEDFGLDLVYLWSILDPDTLSRLDNDVFTHLWPGQGLGLFIEFDQWGLPKPSSLRHPGPPTLIEHRRTLSFFDFFDSVKRGLSKTDGTLLEYLKGYAEGFNSRLISNRQFFGSSGDSRILYLVQRGLHLRLATVRYAIAVTSKLTLESNMGILDLWLEAIKNAPGP